MKTTTLSLTQVELQVLVGVLDAGVKAAGMQVVRPLAPVMEKLEEAAQAFAAPANGADTQPEEATETEMT